MTATTPTPASPQHPQVPPDADVRVWLVSAGELSRRRLEPLLAEAERARAARLRDRGAQARFIVGRATLRLALAAQLSVPPQTLVVGVGAHGRPSLECDGPLDFNVSHAGRLVLCAVARERRIGVDLERTRSLRAGDALAALACDSSEREWLRSLPSHRRQAAFFELWTAKEACLKADGRGLLAEPAAVSIALDPAWRALPRVLGATFDGVRYQVRRLDCARRYRAALATPAGADGGQAVPITLGRPGADADAPGDGPTARRPRRSSASPRRAGRA